MYLVGDKSRVVDVEHPDLEQFPLFPLAQQYKADLKPGDILFIPLSGSTTCWPKTSGWL